MDKNLTKNYINIYFWRSISIISGFLSLLIVVPHLSNNQELYGIYAFCISFSMYLTYADIGFLGAGQKYAAEEFAKGNRDEEIKIFGFTGAILLLMVLPFSLAMIYLSFTPERVINDLSIEGRKIAGNIFLIIGVLSPIQVIIQRLVQSILIIRIKDYISLRIDLVFNILKIFSVFIFFAKARYMVVEYFLFISLMTLFSSVIILIFIYKSENYDFIKLVKSIRLSDKYYQKTKKLAIGSLFLTIGWLIYYELDFIIIGKWFGPHEVAIYAIGFTFLNFLRTLWNTVFSPYSQRFNHFVGVGNMLGLKKLASNIVNYTLPLCVIVTGVLVIFAKPLVLFWVGPDYLRSVIILQILVLGTGFAFITKPASYYFTAETKYKYIYILAITLPLVFLVGMRIFVPIYGITGFAIAKTLAMIVGFFVSTVGISSIVKPVQIMRNWFIPTLTIVGSFIFIMLQITHWIFPSLMKNTIDLLKLILLLGGTVPFIYLLILLTNGTQREDLKMISKKIYLRLNIQ